MVSSARTAIHYICAVFLIRAIFPRRYTATTDEALRRDVELTLAMGSLLRHQAEDPRYLCQADKLGLMVWAEMPWDRCFQPSSSSR